MSCRNPGNYEHRDSSGVSDLPSFLIFEILTKLPIKSIILCKCVSKTWNNLISDSHFANIYFKNPPFTVLVSSPHRPVNFRRDYGSFYFLEVGLNGDVIRTTFNPKALDFQGNGFVGITGSCNGLLCLEQSDPVLQNHDSIYSSQTVYIMNPLLGEFMVLPRVNQSEDIRNVVYGFGFSTKSDHYKVVRFVRRYVVVGLRDEFSMHGEVFTIGVDQKWRSFKDSSIPLHLSGRGITLNGGVLHLVGYERLSSFIFAFDLAKEKGHRIPLPPGFGDEADNALAVCNCNLCLFDNSNEHQVDIWTMKKYGVVESWSREIILKSWIPLDLRPRKLIPVTTLRNGDLLLRREHKGDLLEMLSTDLVSFNPTTKVFSKLEVSHSERARSRLFGYVPSFFPLSTVM